MSLSREVCLLLLRENRIHIYKKLMRRFDVHPINRERLHYGEFDHLYKNLRKLPDRFWQYCRMSVESFDLLLEKVKPRLTKQRKAISAEQRLVLSLRFLATGHSFRDLAFAFRLGRSTVSNIISETCVIIWEELVKAYMPNDSAQINTDEQSRYNRSSNRALNIRNELKQYFWDFRD